MNLKSRYGILCFSLLLCLCNCYTNYQGNKMRAQNIQEYGERLSSVEDEAALKLGRLIENNERKDSETQNKETPNEEIEAANEVNETTTLSTKCTTDRPIDIGMYQPMSDDEALHKDEEGNDNASNNTHATSKEVGVTKLYNPPKQEEAPDHYIDDV